MSYRRIALQLFDELSMAYAEDIRKHIDLCKRYPVLASEWEQIILAYLDSIEKSEDYDKEAIEESKRKLYEKIKNENL